MNLTVFLYAIGFAFLGYLSGSLPFSIWVTRLIKGVDVRDSGSGHATTTNTFRQAGFLPGALVLILDITKGFLPTWLALRYAPTGWIIPLTALFTVVGHCWPVFAGFRGGMGMASAQGALLAAAPLAVPVCVGFVVLLMLILKHSARASVFAGLSFAPLVWLVGLRGVVFWIALAVGLVIAIRYLIDWNREYKELWLDRDKKTTD